MKSLRLTFYVTSFLSATTILALLALRFGYEPELLHGRRWTVWFGLLWVCSAALLSGIVLYRDHRRTAPRKRAITPLEGGALTLAALLLAVFFGYDSHLAVRVIPENELGSVRVQVQNYYEDHIDVVIDNRSMRELDSLTLNISLVRPDGTKFEQSVFLFEMYGCRALATCTIFSRDGLSGYAPTGKATVESGFYHEWVHWKWS